MSGESKGSARACIGTLRAQHHEMLMRMRIGLVVTAGVVSTQVGRRLGIPVLVSLDSGELVSLDDIRYGLQRRWIDRRAAARTIRDAARITVATDFMARMRPLAGARVDVIPMGIDTGSFPTATCDGTSDGPPWRLLRVATLNAVKDYPTLLQA